MSPPDTAALETSSPAELRDLVGALGAKVAELGAANVALKSENQALRDEVARLKDLPPRPPLRPSGMEKATGGTGTGRGGKRSRRRRGAKRDRDAITGEVVVKAAAPAGSRFKGYQDILVRELRLSAEVVRFRRERWLTPSGETVLAACSAARRLRFFHVQPMRRSARPTVQGCTRKPVSAAKRSRHSARVRWLSPPASMRRSAASASPRIAGGGPPPMRLAARRPSSRAAATQR